MRCNVAVLAIAAPFSFQTPRWFFVLSWEVETRVASHQAKDLAAP